MKPRHVASVIALVCAIASPGVFGAIDITAYMRSVGSDSYSMDIYGDTEMANGYSSAAAVDGVYAVSDVRVSAGRVLFAKNITSGLNPCDLRYSLRTFGGTNFIGRVSAFTVYRLHADANNDFTRSPTRFALYGSNGGDAWTLLFANDEAVVWDEATRSVTFAIPPEKQNLYSQFRFAVDASTASASYVGYHELVLTGDLYESRVWTGATGPEWNAVDANWEGNTGAAPLWDDVDVGVFGDRASNRAVVVDESGVILDGLVVQDAGYSFSGGNLNMRPSAQFTISASATISSDIADVVPSATPAQREYLPYTADKSTGTWVKLWENRILAATTFTGGYINITSWGAGPATVCHPVTNALDGSVSVQFQYLPEGENKPLFCIKVEFKQIERDIWARAVYSGYSWSVRDGTGELGEDFDSDSKKNTANDLDKRNVKDITVADLPCAPLRFNVGSSVVEDCYGGSCLPGSGSNAKTGEEVLCWANRNLRDLDAIESFSFYDGNSSITTATLHYFENNGETASFQLQYNRAPSADGRTPRLCVKVELRQDGSDIKGRVVYAKYHWYQSGEEAVAMDFDPVSASSSAVNVRDDSHASDGYGAGDLRARFRSWIRITGDFESAQDIEINGGVLSLGASSLSLAQDVSGTGTLEFSPESGTQTVSVGADAAPTVGAARFSGTVTLEVAKGGSIAFDSVSFADGAIVNLVVPGGASANQSVRVGTTASLTSAELAHFLVDGNPVKYQTEDGWLAAGAAGLVIFVR